MSAFTLPLVLDVAGVFKILLASHHAHKIDTLCRIDIRSKYSVQLLFPTKFYSFSRDLNISERCRAKFSSNVEKNVFSKVNCAV